MKTKFGALLAATSFIALAALVSAEDKPQVDQQPKLATPVTSKAPASATNVAAEANPTIIGFIETRGRTIIIKAGPNGTIYSVKTTDGKVLCENVSADQLRAQAPELHEFIKSGIAEGSGEKIDARVRLHSLIPSRAKKSPTILDARF